MSKPLQLEFVDAALHVDLLPESRAEVVLIGRSNVGKSSLLNALCNKDLAPVSKTPGRTKALGCFAVGRTGATLVDCPGYGYAKGPKQLRAGWPPMLEHYLQNREPLVMVLLLVDGEIGPTDSDLEMLEWLRQIRRAHTVVATKHDKVKPSARDRRQKELCLRCELPPSSVIWVSAEEGLGIPLLRERIHGWLARTDE